MTKRCVVDMQLGGLRILAVVMTAGLLSGCASIMLSGTRQSIRVSSMPSAAVVKIEGVERGRTPLNVKLERMKPQVIRLELEGYRPYEVVPDQKLNPLVWGNVVFLIPGMAIGLLVDLSYGAGYNLVPRQVHAQLVQGNTDEQATPSPVVSLPSFLGKPPDGKALICLYRNKNFFGSAGGWDISDNGTKIANLQNGACFYYFAEPGEHRYHSSMAFEKEITVISLSAGDIRFVRAQISGPLTVMPSQQAIEEIEKGSLR